MDAKVIIGMNFGDEGKGLATDYFAKQSILQGHKTLVVCNNGGPQRSHTVSLLNGTRHAFRHIGSGAFAGADTYLSEFFIVNPMVFAQEFKELLTLGYRPVVYVDKKCRITTPYEMYLNQMLEESRGENRHGSCGMGIWETVRLYDEIQPAEYRWGQAVNLNRVTRHALFNTRVKEYKDKKEITSEVYLNWSAIIDTDLNNKIMSKYMNDLQFMFDHTTVCDAEIIKTYDNVIFENGQGLLLNDDPNNVHTTPSNTGLDNIRILENNFSFKAEPVYVTRPYLTRHGADPAFISDDAMNQKFDGSDQTNVPNEFQGKMRYSKMDEDFLNRVKKDSFDRDFSILITHANEYCIPDVMNDNLHKISTYYSVGKERESVR